MATKKSTTSKTPWEKPAPRKAHHSALTPAQKRHAKARAQKAGRSYPNLVDNMHEAAASSGTRKKATKRKAVAKSGATKKSAVKKRASARKKAPARSAARKKAPAKSAARKKAPAKKAPTKSAAREKRAPTKKKTARAPRRTAAARQARQPTRDPKGGLTAAGRRLFHERDGSNLKPGVQKKPSEMSTEEMRRKGSWAARFYGRKVLPALQDAAGEPTRFALSAAAWGEPVPKTVKQARAIAARGKRLLEVAARSGSRKRSKVRAQQQ